MEELITRLIDHNVHLSLQEDNLKIKFNGNNISEDLLAQIKQSKQEIIAYLRTKNLEDHVVKVIPPVNRDSEGYVLSSSQRRLWLLSQVEAGRVAYNMPIAFIFEGDLNVRELEASFNVLIERHESLRTIFKENQAGELRQFVLTPEQATFRISESDLRGQKDADLLLKRITIESFNVVFNLETGPLIKAEINRITDQKWVFSFVMHHIISDGWSLDVLVKELLQLYNSTSDFRENLFSPLRIQYKDFAVWQQGQLKDKSFSSQREYWLSQMAGELPVLHLFENRQRPVVKTFNGSVAHHAVPEDSFSRLKFISRETGTTLFMNLLATVYLLLYRLTGQKDIIIGSPIAGRENVDLENQIGFYINTLAIRLRLDGTESYYDTLEKVRKVTMGAFENQEYPFDELVSELDIKQDRSRNPIFDVMVVLQNADLNSAISDVSLKDINVTAYTPEAHTSSLFDIKFDFRERDQNLTLVIEYNTDVFDSSEIAQILAYFDLLSRTADVTLLDLPELIPEEKRKLLGTFNNTHVNFDRSTSIMDLFERQVFQSPDSIALICDRTTLSYRQLNDQANQLANLLQQEIGITPESRIGLLLTRGTNLIVSIFAILKAGGCYVPLEFEYPEERILYMLEDSSVETLITDKNLIELSNRLLWRSQTKNLICCNSLHVQMEPGLQKNELMSKELWEFIGNTATDQIGLGGWKSSYTGLDFSQVEMQEYAENASKKLKSYLHEGAKVLELGCSSGLTLFEIAPLVGKYIGTDLSQSILDRTQKAVDNKGLSNVYLKCLAALDVDQIQENGFDVIILNSVIQCFHGPNYLYQVLLKAISKLNDHGVIFIGDIMDEEMRNDMIVELTLFKEMNHDKSYQTKTDFSSELFISRKYLEDLINDQIGIESVIFSDKIHTKVNELTKFRFDALLKVNKKGKPSVKSKNKNVYDLRDIQYQSTDFIRQQLPTNVLTYVIYTSGSTGQPKGVMVEQLAFLNLLLWYKDLLDLGNEGCVLLSSPICFDLTQKNIFTPLLSGARLCLPETLYIDYYYLAELIEKENVSVVNCAPSAFYPLLDQSINSNFTKLSTLKYVVLGGEPIHKKEFLPWKASEFFHTKIINSYGPTECTDVVSYYQIQQDEWTEEEHVPIGVPINNCSLYILNDEKNMVPINVPGEIYISGICVSRGYLNSKTMNEDKFLPNPFQPGLKMYKTGDLGKWSDTGNITFLGRVDDQVKIRGNRIELGEIEAALISYSGVQSAVVRAKLSPVGEQELVAYLVCNNKPDLAVIRLFLSKILATYMLPNHIIFLEAFPLNANGKIDKKALPDPDSYLKEFSIEQVDPHSESEKVLVSVLSEILKRNIVSVKEDFFAAGGDSIKAIKLTSQLRQRGLSLSIKDVMLHPVIADMALFIKSGKSVIDQDPVTGSSPLSPIQEAFFYKSSPDNERHFNQSVLLTVDAQLSDVVLRQSVDKLFAHHDYLRANFYKHDGHWVDNISPIGEYPILDIVDYDEESFIAYCDRVQSGFSLEQGALFKVVFFKGAKQQRLMLVAHHLVIDGVSWRILLEDLISCYDQISLDRQATLPNKTHSYKFWKESSFAYANSDLLKNDELYWDQIDAGASQKNINPDYPTGTNNIGDIAVCTFSVTTAEIKLLQKHLYVNEGASINEIILTAFVLACSELFEVNEIIVKMESHGRQNLTPDLNVSRTLGWFTSEFPVPIRVSEDRAALSQLAIIKQSFQNIPNEGLGYGMLKYSKHKKYKLEPEISFNYLGEFDTIIHSNSLNQDFLISSQNHGKAAADSFPRISLIDFWGVASSEQTLFGINYSDKQFNKTTIDKLVRNTQKYLTSLME